MMDKATINQLVESYLNGKSEWGVPDSEPGISASERFELKTAKRLKIAFDLYQDDRRYYGDFLLAFRDYLLVFQAFIAVDSVNISSGNSFGIGKDDSNGRYFASYLIPEYLNSTFAKEAFAHKEPERRNNYDRDLHTDPLIRSVTGYKYFKSTAQKLAVYGALNTPDGCTTLVSLPTGGGKSLITQTMSYQKEGLTIIVVPTVSLAIDQVRVAKGTIKSKNVDEEIFSYSNGVDARPIFKAIREKKARMLFISPEALINNPGFVDVISEANKTRYLKNLIIDEAHIVVDWGAQFRVEYQCLEAWRNKLMLSNTNIRTVLLSATFEDSCIEILKSLFTTDVSKWIEVRCDSLRHEPRFALVSPGSDLDKDEKMVELVRKAPHPMIVYVDRPVEADRVVGVLKENGINNVKTFTGLTTGAKRKELIDAWVDDRFEIMVATCAFGVGVDKSDVRTVLHTYVPPNPNAYYQELGRGGRDRLPCLSIMCAHWGDLQSAQGRITKRVMTTEKIVGRWNSMYNNPRSRRVDNVVFIDTSIKPNYAVDDEYDDAPTSDADMNWNIYVLLFLRRNGLIKIREVSSQQFKYVFEIEIQDNRLREADLEQTVLIDSFREKEYKSYLDSFKIMRSAFRNSGAWCWSEMFYDTYTKVSAYCAGCNAHEDAEEDDLNDYPLKALKTDRLRPLAEDQLALFGGDNCNNLAIVAGDAEERRKTFEALSRLRISAFVTDDEDIVEEFVSATPDATNVLILNPRDLKELVGNGFFYYLSGLVAIYYDEDAEKTRDLLRFTTNRLSRVSDVKAIHIPRKNQYFEGIGKAFVDLIDGPVINVKSLER